MDGQTDSWVIVAEMPQAAPSGSQVEVYMSPCSESSWTHHSESQAYHQVTNGSESMHSEKRKLEWSWGRDLGVGVAERKMSLSLASCVRLQDRKSPRPRLGMPVLPALSLSPG